MELHGIGALMGKSIATIQKCDNGFIVNLIETPKMPERAKSTDPDGEIDELIDGLVAMNKHFAGGIDGEEWREGNAGDRRRIREAFKKISPGLMHQLQPCPQPRVEMKVFATKQELFAYLANNL